MKNSDMPAMPVQGFSGDDLKLYGQLHHGMTKREAFAMAAMQGYLSNSHLADVLTSNHAIGVDVQTILISSSVESADALLAELEK